MVIGREGLVRVFMNLCRFPTLNSMFNMLPLTVLSKINKFIMLILRIKA